MNTDLPRQKGLEKPLSGKQQILLTLIPVILFTLAEEWGGLSWALGLSVIYAVFELSWEFWRFHKISGMTLFSNAMVVGLSLVSYYTQDGMWFKLQPAILEVAMAVILIGSFLLKKPMLIALMEQQGHSVTDEMRHFFGGLTLRMGYFFLFQAGLAVFAALYWSTEIWAFLKSVGVLVMMVLYMLIEVFIHRVQKINQ